LLHSYYGTLGYRVIRHTAQTDPTGTVFIMALVGETA